MLPFSFGLFATWRSHVVQSFRHKAAEWTPTHAAKQLFYLLSKFLKCRVFIIKKRHRVLGSCDWKVACFKPHPRLAEGKQNEKSTHKGCFSVLVAGVGFEPHGLRVMSPTSYQAALPRDMEFENGAGERGRTVTEITLHGILSPGCLPIPPLRHAGAGASRFTCLAIIA